MGGVLGPAVLQLAAIFGAFGAAIGLPLLLADPEKRARRIGLLLVLAAGLLFVHGELRSAPVVRFGCIAFAGVLAAVLLGVGARGWLLHRAMLAERPRPPDEWAPGDGRRLWSGKLGARLPLAAREGAPECIYRRVEIDRWDDGRWRRIATLEERAEGLELAGRTRTMAAQIPLAALRRGAVELEKFRASSDGWRHDPDPDPAALYRARTVGVPVGASVRVLARAERRGDEGLVLVGVPVHAFSWTETHAMELATRAGLCAAAALACALAGLWGAWP